MIPDLSFPPLPLPLEQIAVSLNRMEIEEIATWNTTFYSFLLLPVSGI